MGGHSEGIEGFFQGLVGSLQSFLCLGIVCVAVKIQLVSTGAEQGRDGHLCGGSDEFCSEVCSSWGCETQLSRGGFYSVVPDNDKTVSRLRIAYHAPLAYTCHGEPK